MRRTALLGVTGAVLLSAPAVLAPAPSAAPPAVAPAPVAVPVAVPDPAAPVGPTTDDDTAPGATPTADVPATAAAPAATVAPAAPAAPATVTDGSEVIITPGRAAIGTGPLLTYTVEVEVATDLAPTAVADAVATALGDPRSWGRIRTLHHVDEASRAMARIIVARPETVDALCAEAGLDTAGIYSCWNGRVVALNAWRWEAGADGFPDLATYRTYLVNHEVGHVLGRGHVGCPAAGAAAPLMMQQSKGLDGCTANPWPFP